MSEAWSAADVPSQDGRTAVITGGNSGIGFQAAKVLASRGASVVLACRDTGRAREAADRIAASVPAAAVSVAELDLASLAAIRAAADAILERCGRLDLLINNAGVMVPPYATTADGFELQFGVNHLGHFALTGLLAPRLLTTPGSRVVTVASMAHWGGQIRFGDLQSQQRYRRQAAYAQSKLANLLFTYELQRRFAAAGTGTAALAAHPGYARTSLDRYMPSWLRAASVIAPAQDAAGGALPTLRAATDPAARGGDYYGPSGLLQLRGAPRRVGSSARSRDTAAQEHLWQESERLTGITYPV